MKRVHFPDKYPNGKMFTWMETWDNNDKSDVEVRLVFYINNRKQAFAFTEFRDAVKEGLNHKICYYYECGPVTDLSLLPENLHDFQVWIDPTNPPDGIESECKRRWNDSGIVFPVECPDKQISPIDGTFTEESDVLLKTDKPVTELDDPQPSIKQQVGFTI